jgi:hypothetical protein
LSPELGYFRAPVLSCSSEIIITNTAFSLSGNFSYLSAITAIHRRLDSPQGVISGRFPKLFKATIQNHVASTAAEKDV